MGQSTWGTMKSKKLSNHINKLEINRIINDINVDEEPEDI